VNAPVAWFPVPLLNWYGDVPPTLATVNEPVEAPKQLTDTELLNVVVMRDACETVTAWVTEQVLASVIVTTYAPAPTPVNAPVGCAPVPLLKDKAPVPPPAETVNAPVVAPLQVTEVLELSVEVIAAGAVIVTGTVTLQLLASKTVTT
jgi:hypothetical protein